MPKQIRRGIYTSWSFMLGVVKRVVSDATTYLHVLRSSVSNGIRSFTVLVVEKWLSFCEAFWVSLFPALIGLLLLELEYRLSGDLLTPALIFNSIIGTIGYFIMLLTIPAWIGVFSVSIARLIFWTRDTIVSTWKKHTPPFTERNNDLNNSQWPASQITKEKAEMEFLCSVKFGSVLFFILVLVLTYVDLNHPNLLQLVISNLDLSWTVEFTELPVPIINVEGLLTLFLPKMTQYQLAFIIIGLGIPGLFFAVAARNGLFLRETFYNETIAEVANASLPTRERILLVFYFIGITFLTILALYSLFTSIFG